jgi:hypothetical protein
MTMLMGSCLHAILYFLWNSSIKKIHPFGFITRPRNRMAPLWLSTIRKKRVIGPELGD